MNKCRLCPRDDQEPLLTNASYALESFVGNERLSWATKFEKFKEPKQSWIEIVTIIAVVTGAFATTIQAVLPEAQKEAILNLLSQFLSSPSVFMLFPIVVLSYGLLRYLRRLGRTHVRWRDIKKVKED